MANHTVKKAILPAAGLGTRFLPATKASPKEMLPIVDKPLIQYAVEEAASCGIEQFLIITGKNKRPIEDHFDMLMPELEETLRKGGKQAVIDDMNTLLKGSFAYIRQGTPLGLGHAVGCAAPFVGDEAVAVLLSDDIIHPSEPLLADMIKLYDEYKGPVVALMRVPRYEVSRYGVIKGSLMKGNAYRIEDMVEKPKSEEAPSDLAIIGRYILTPDTFDVLKSLPPGRGGEIQLTDALRALAAARPVYGLLYEGRRYDAGDKLGFLKATVDFALETPALSEEFAAFIRTHTICT